VPNVAAIGQKHTADSGGRKQNKERRRKSIRHGAVFGAFKDNGTGECRRTLLVRLFTVILPVITGVASQNVRGGEIWPATAGGGSLFSKRCVFYSCLLVLGGDVNFNCSRIASERRAGRS